MSVKAKFPWETKTHTYQEWGNMSFDWGNYNKLINTVPSYFFRYNGYKKGMINSHILGSVFGRKNMQEIEEEVSKWYDACIGAYNQITI